jgi:hypothetical protein
MTSVRQSLLLDFKIMDKPFLTSWQTMSLECRRI